MSRAPEELNRTGGNPMSTLIKSGFAFFRALDEYRTIFENKFTGLRVIYDSRTDSHEVIREE